MAQKQNEKEALLCTFEECKELQGADGEFCETHNPSRLYKAFQLTTVCRADLENQGFDSKDVTDETMQELANKMGEAIMEEFWIDMDIIAPSLGIKQK